MFQRKMALNVIAVSSLFAVLNANFILDQLVPLLPLLTGCPSKTTYDYIIVGAGAAGSVVANRLTENPNIHVLLLEAGSVPLPGSDIPLNFGLPLIGLNGPMDWNFPVVPQANCCNAYSVFNINQGKALGGGTAINCMLYTRGNSRDYDMWAQLLGDTGWNYTSVLEYFKKLEDYQIPMRAEDEPYHSKGGPVTVSLPSFKSQMADSYLEAADQLGYRLTDYNAKTQFGFMFPPFNIKKGVRASTFHAYLEPAQQRPNLKIQPLAFVTKILINAQTMTATGVAFDIGNAQCTASATREVILSAGSIQSPKILMYSGIGPKDTLTKFNISVIQDLPGVGQNLKDHPGFIHSQYSTSPSSPIRLSYLLNRLDPLHILAYAASQTGPYSSPGSMEGLSFFNSSIGTSDWPDSEIISMNSNTLDGIAFQLRLKPEYEQVLKFYPGYNSFIIIITRPKSTGYVTINSTDPYSNPVINPRYFSHPDDIKVIVEGMRKAEALTKTYPFTRFGAQMVPYVTVGCESLDITSDEFYECVGRAWVMSFMHVTSTCKMANASDPMGVVDNKLKVRGIQRLRIVDASIMPNIPAAHTNVPTMMIGEKGSDLIKADQKF